MADVSSLSAQWWTTWRGDQPPSGAAASSWPSDRPATAAASTSGPSRYRASSARRSSVVTTASLGGLAGKAGERFVVQVPQPGRRRRAPERTYSTYVSEERRRRWPGWGAWAAKIRLPVRPDPLRLVRAHDVRRVLPVGVVGELARERPRVVGGRHRLRHRDLPVLPLVAGQGHPVAPVAVVELAPVVERVLVAAHV